jgi:hypothetical protein
VLHILPRSKKKIVTTQKKCGSPTMRGEWELKMDGFA